MTDLPPAGGRAAVAARPGLIDRHDLVATRDRVAGKRNDHLGARRQRKTSLLHPWPGQPGQDRRIALMPVRPGQRGAQLF